MWKKLLPWIAVSLVSFVLGVGLSLALSSSQHVSDAAAAKQAATLARQFREDRRLLGEQLKDASAKAESAESFSRKVNATIKVFSDRIDNAFGQISDGLDGDIQLGEIVVALSEQLRDGLRSLREDTGGQNQGP